MSETGKVTVFEMRNAAQMDLAVLTRSMPCARSLHKDAELVYVCDGELEVLIDDESVTVRAGETLIIGSFVIHEFVPPENDVTALRVKLVAQWLEAPFWNDAEKEKLRSLFSRALVLRRDERLLAIFGALQKNMGRPLASYCCLAEMMKLTALLLEDPELIDRFCYSQMTGNGSLSEALEYLYLHCHEEMTLGMLADHMGMSESYCSKSFHQMLGVTFTEFVNTLRISNARWLLLNTSQAIIQVAQEAGFSSIQTFNRVFRKICGCTPSEYRIQSRVNRERLPEGGRV